MREKMMNVKQRLAKKLKKNDIVEYCDENKIFFFLYISLFRAKLTIERGGKRENG